MKKQQKQQETNTDDDLKVLVSDEMRREPSESVSPKSTKVKRTHSRSFYMATNPKGGAVPGKQQLPVFWRKSLAKKIAQKLNGKVVKVSMSWE